MSSEIFSRDSSALAFPDLGGAEHAAQPRLAEVVVLRRLGGKAAQEAVPSRTTDEEEQTARKTLTDLSQTLPLGETRTDQFGIEIPVDAFSERQADIKHYNAIVASYAQHADIRERL